ncbi:MAG: Type 1 glutamine amidotransferase-like domain-containing protein [Propionicimonas sp.]|nr:Type 1 glutamine amidotransferase-like domain-containing protein [Propionicimonas sp.]
MTTHIVAMGGGGFSMSQFGAPTNLDRYLLELSGKQAPLVCFAPTASADDPQYINRFLLAYGTLGVRTMVLSLWDGGSARSVARLAEADVLLVGGGHTVNLVALWDVHGVSQAVRALAARGDVVLAGISAGGNCWYEGCITDSFGDVRPWHGGLGLVRGSFCPHFDGEAERAPVYTDAVATGELPAGYAADDGAAVHYIDGVPTNFVAEARGQRVYRVMPSDLPTASGVLVEPQEMTLL